MSFESDLALMDHLRPGPPPVWTTTGYRLTPQYALERRFLEAERLHDRTTAHLFLQADALTHAGASSLLGPHGLRGSVLREGSRLLRLVSTRRRKAMRDVLAHYQQSLAQFEQEANRIERALRNLHPRWWPQHAALFDSPRAALVALSERRYVNVGRNKWARERRLGQAFITGFQLLALGETQRLGWKLKDNRNDLPAYAKRRRATRPAAGPETPTPIPASDHADRIG